MWNRSSHRGSKRSSTPFDTLLQGTIPYAVFERSAVEGDGGLGGDEETTAMCEGLCRKTGTAAVEGGTVALPKGNYGGSMRLERAAGAKCHPSIYIYLCYSCPTDTPAPGDCLSAVGFATAVGQLACISPSRQTLAAMATLACVHHPCRRPAAGRDTETSLDHNNPPLISL
jgi:hypothetical protein